MSVTGPTVVRRQLGRRLRALRQRSGMTEAEITATKALSKAKLYRIEAGAVPVNITDVWALCRIYGADEKTTDALATLAAGTTDKNWWEDYSDVMDAGIALYIGLEETAQEIRTCEVILAPGLFQTADYTRAMIRGERPDWDEDAIDRSITLRAERQRKVLGRSHLPRITAVLDAAALARQVGGPEVMAAQIQHMRQLASLDHIDIRVIPFEAGAHAFTSGAFTILEFADPDDPAVAHTDNRIGARYVEKPEQVDEFRAEFEAAKKQSVTLEECEAR